jgi:hypothetical protein
MYASMVLAMGVDADGGDELAKLPVPDNLAPNGVVPDSPVLQPGVPVRDCGFEPLHAANQAIATTKPLPRTNASGSVIGIFLLRGQ